MYGLFEKAYEGDLQAFLKENITMKSSFPNAERARCMPKAHSSLLPVSSDCSKLCASIATFMMDCAGACAWRLLAGTMSSPHMSDNEQFIYFLIYFIFKF